MFDIIKFEVKKKILSSLYINTHVPIRALKTKLRIPIISPIRKF